jgi:hypothetical protein
MKKIFALNVLTLILLFFIIQEVVKASDLLKQMYGGSLFESEPDWTVSELDNPSPGYLRLEWPSTNDFYLVDNYGIQQYDYSNKISSFHFKLLSNGFWISPSETKYYLFNQELNLVDSIPNPTSYILDFHEVELLSNGHYLIMCIEQNTMDLSEIVDGGSKAALILSNVLVETDRTGKIYWQWKAFDHTKITDVTSDIDLTLNVIDFTHINSFIEDNNGNILISFRHLDEISKINKSTGDFIWRMGGSKCKNNEFAFNNDLNNDFTGFSHQHSISILHNGNILLYDNGNMKKEQFSRAVEYQINETTKTATKVWEYRNNPDIFCPMMGSVYRLPNGNTLINWGTKAITEVKPDKTKAIELTYQSSNPFSIYRAYKIITRMNAVTVNINSTKNYSFNDVLNTTGVNIYVSSLNGTGSASIEKHDYAPPKAFFADSNFTSIFPYRWVFTQTGITSISGLFNIKASTLSNIPDPNKVSLYQRYKESAGTFQEISTSYNSTTDEISANLLNFGEFILVSKVLGTPSLLIPANNNEKTSLNGTMKWNKLKGANKYQLQVAYNKEFNEPKIDLVIDNQTEYNYNNFESATKYFWRIRGLNSKDTSKWSDTYIFTTENFMIVELLTPENNTFGFKFSDTLSWKEISGAEYYWIQVSKDSKFSNFITNNSNLKQVKQQINGLDFDQQYFWRVRAYHNLDTSAWSEIRTFRTEMPQPQLESPLSDTINALTEIYFSWEPVNGAEYYNLEISESILFNNIIISSKNIFDSHIVITNFDFNKQYFWRIKALRSTDSTTWLEIWNFQTLLKKPTLVYPLNQQSKLKVNSNFVWEKLETATSYRLLVLLSQDFNSIIIDTIIDLSNQFLPVELPPNKEIFWRIMAINGKKLSDWSDTWSFFTDKGLLLELPKLSSPKDNTENNISGDLIWSKVDKAFKYSVQLSLTNDFKKLIINSNNIKNSIIHYTNLDYEKIHFCRVKAYSLFDSSQYSESWMMKTFPFKSIVILISPGNDDLQIPVTGKLSWDSIPNKDFYDVQISEDILFTKILIDTNNITQTNFIYSGLQLNSEYYWRVRFKKGEDYSPWSEVWSFTTVAPETLPAPELKTPYESKIGAPINGALSWVAVPKAETYQISLSKNRNFSSIFLKNSEIIETLFLYSNLEYNQTYFWRVSAVAENAKSSWSEQRIFLTELEPPIILYPEEFAKDIHVNDGVLWTVTNDMTLYHIQIANDSAFNNIVEDFDNIYEMNHNFNLSPNTKYYCRVKAYNDSNQSRWSKYITFTTGIATSVKNINSYNDISVYPNPATDNIQLSDDRYEGLKYQIYSIDGFEIFNGIIEHDTINITDLCSNFYYLKLGNKFIGFIKL